MLVVREAELQGETATVTGVREGKVKLTLQNGDEKIISTAETMAF